MTILNSLAQLPSIGTSSVAETSAIKPINKPQSRPNKAKTKLIINPVHFKDKKSFATSSASFDRLAAPMAGGNKKPSETGCTGYRSKDPNFARTVNDKTITVRANRTVKFLIEQAKQDKSYKTPTHAKKSSQKITRPLASPYEFQGVLSIDFPL